MRCPAMRIKMERPVFASAPMPKKAASKAAATGIETGKEAESEEVKISMIRPSVKGTDRETAEDTASY